jgi:hypothetical protein
MSNVNFENSSALIEAAQRFDSNLSQCLNCGIIWLSNHKDKNGVCLSQEDLKILVYSKDGIKDLPPSEEQLASWNVFISHGLCHPCMREVMIERYRTRQKGSGYHPCFATAVHGHCSQHECAYYDLCVVDQNELYNWEERKRMLL